jgi:alginate O-acetyltransferase complex protein AlgJ
MHYELNKEKENFALSIIFMSVLFVPGVLYLLSFYTFEFPERLKNQKKKVQYKYFYENEFFLKKKIITLNNEINLNLLGSRTFNNVHLGNEGWLFLSPKGVESPIENLKGKNQIPNSVMQNLKGYFDYWLNQDVDYYYMIAPNKHSLYREQLRLFFPLKAYESSFHPIERYSKSLRLILGENFIEIFDDFVEYKKSVPLLYQKTDTHWNEIGAFKAYQKVMNLIVRNHKINNYSENPAINISEKIEHGDLHKMLTRGNEVNFQALVKDSKQILVDFKNPPCHSEQLKKLLSKSSIGEIQVFDCPSRKKTLFIIGDSFRRYFLKYFPAHFNKTVIMNGEHYYPYMVRENGKPDIVLQVRSERGGSVHKASILIPCL